MKLLCLPIAFLYAVVKGQLMLRLSLRIETPILSLEAGRRVFHGNKVTANLADLSSVIYNNATQSKSSKLKGVAQSDGE